MVKTIGAICNLDCSYCYYLRKTELFPAGERFRMSDETLEAYAYDAAEAKRLIEEAGVAGQTITLVGESSGRWLNDKELLEAVAGYWTEAGLVVDLQTPEFGAYLDVLFDRENRADAIFVSSSNDILDPNRQLATYYAAGGIGSSNSNEELKALVDEAHSVAHTTDKRAGRHQRHELIQALAKDENRHLLLVTADAPEVADGELAGSWVPSSSRLRHIVRNAPMPKGTPAKFCGTKSLRPNLLGEFVGGFRGILYQNGGIG